MREFDGFESPLVHLGGFSMNAHGYIQIFMPNHHRANSWGVTYEHIVRAEEKLGRELTDEEVVHHRDGNRSNNTYDNLLVFHTKSDHTRFHKLNCTEDVLKQLSDGSYVVDLLPSDICPLCGNYKDRKSAMCLDCGQKIQRHVERPTREELKYLIRTKSFLSIGKQFGVSDNAIRKWCDFEHLPRKKEDIKKYSDEEWKNI